MAVRRLVVVQLTERAGGDVVLEVVDQLVGTTSPTALLVLLAVANAAWVTQQTVRARIPLERPTAYRALAGSLIQNSGTHEVVVAPWGAFPGLFFFNDRRRAERRERSRVG